MTRPTFPIKLEDVLAAKTRLHGRIHRTPLLHSKQLSDRLGCEVYLKVENLQKTGSFKARGALNFLLSETEAAPVYTTFSSGNHGQALAWSAQTLGYRAVIFMPEDASHAKVAAVKGYGGEVRYAGTSSDDRRQACEAFADAEGACIVPPYDHPRIIAGQGSIMLEILEDLPLFDAAFIPVGGGGLLSGNALVAYELGRTTAIYCCEPEAAADAKASLAAGQLKRIDYPHTIADGARNLCLGNHNWAIVRETVRAGLTCSEAQIKAAMRLYAVFTKMIVEPSGALSLACLAAHCDQFTGRKVVLVVSGGNVALPQYASWIEDNASDLG